MAALVAAIHFPEAIGLSSWMAGTSPAMTAWIDRCAYRGTHPARHPFLGMAAKRKKKKTKKWSGRVTRESDALDLKKGVFKLNDPRKIAASLKRSAERSHRRKADPYRSALSMLTFYINRAGKNLPASRKKKLNDAKAALKTLFHKGTPGKKTKSKTSRRRG
jgi:hypothetical protein